MQEIPNSVVSSPYMDKILVDSKAACRAEAGELQQLDWEYDTRIVEIGVLSRQQHGKNAESSKSAGPQPRWTLFKSVGVGVQDVAIAHFILEKAVARGLGSLVPFN